MVFLPACVDYLSAAVRTASPARKKGYSPKCAEGYTDLYQRRVALRRRCGAVRHRSRSGACYWAHRVDADDDRGDGVHRQLVADVTAAEQLAQQTALPFGQANVEPLPLE